MYIYKKRESAEEMEKRALAMLPLHRVLCVPATFEEFTKQELKLTVTVKRK